MTNAEIQKALNNFAARDMRFARKHGSLYITDTKRGCIELRYHHENKRYSITATDLRTADGRPSPEVDWLSIGDRAAAAKAMLVSLYTVEIA